MPESTTIIAFDQHADSLMAAVLPHAQTSRRCNCCHRS